MIDRDEEAVAAVVAAPDKAYPDLDAGGWAAVVLLVEVAALYRADRTGSWLEAASVGSVNPPAGCHPSCYLERVAAVQDLAEDSDYGCPTAGQEEHPAHLAVDMLADVHLVAVAHLLDLANHWSAGPSTKPDAL